MKRLPFKPLLFLPLGLLTTISIAWASAAFDDPKFMKQGIDRVDSGARSRHFMTLWYRGRTGERVVWTLFEGSVSLPEDRDIADPRTALPIFRRAGFFPRWWGTAPAIADELAGPRYHPMWVHDARGWPVVALWCGWDSPGTWRGNMPTPPEGPVHGGIDLPPFPKGFIGGQPRALPCRPIWRGLIADTLFFGLAWFILLFGTSTVRRTLRLRRGLCPRCAYNLAGLPPDSPCPECGHAPSLPRPSETRP